MKRLKAASRVPSTHESMALMSGAQSVPSSMQHDPQLYSAFLARLSRRGQFEGTAAVWQEALPWLRELFQACGAYLVYSAGASLHLAEGEIPTTVQPALRAWEQSLTQLLSWIPPDETPVSTPPSLPMLEATLEGLHVRAIPLWDDKTLVGGLALLFREKAPPEEAIDAWLGLLAAIAQVASLSNRLHAMQHRLTHLTIFHDIGQKLTSTLDLRVVLRETMSLATSALAADAATLMLVDEERQELVFEIPTGSAGGALVQQRMPITQGIAGWVATHGTALICNDVGSDPRFDSGVDAKTGYVTRSVICVPLQIKGRTIGVLEVLNKRPPAQFDQADLEWLTMLGAQAAIAIDNARLYDDLRQEQERIIRVQEQERHALAQALHDGPTATVGALIMSLEMALRMAENDSGQLQDELSYLIKTSRVAYRELRQLLFELRPVILSTRGLLAALRTHATYLQDTSRFQFQLDLPESLPPLSPQLAEAVFMIIQEAINNVRKHAQAANCWLRLRVVDEGRRLVAEIEDDGLGFDPKDVNSGGEERGSLGMLGMRERADRLGARLSFLSPRPGAANGSLVRLEVPIERLIASG